MRKSKIYPWYFALGSVLVYSVLSVLPGILGIGYSFTDWSAYSPDLHFVGLKNFAEVFSGNNDYIRYITNTLWFTVVTTILKTGLGLLFAFLGTYRMIINNFKSAKNAENLNIEKLDF